MIAESADGIYDGDTSAFKTYVIRALAITYMKFATFADIVMRHRISLMEETMRFIEDTWLGRGIG
ncbi:MAG: hypothetical protein PVJ87_06970 [Desulfobacterales bacterium]